MPEHALHYPYSFPMRPRIGMPLCLDDRDQWRPGRKYLYIDQAYSKAVIKAGGDPRLLAMDSDPRDQVNEVEGLILPGGDDFQPFEPHRYQKSVAFNPISEKQLKFDQAILDAAQSREIPILGICYGAQLMALHQGGSLHYHLPEDLPGSQDHQLPERDGVHSIEIKPQTRLSEIVKQGEIDVNSLHHQGIASPGEGFRICAQARDGVIEAIESDNTPFQIGVQWHPERLLGPAGEGLLRALVSACESR
ncbi:MAG: gamma-glutamyl-gamma-aminobutyrate hydrolase [Deltaproteobacteria bacterium]|nr:gamma-glutamyl-gamma-aminobutyrate hydrolase [Deltaproteobacteria bacterium]